MCVGKFVCFEYSEMQKKKYEKAGKTFEAREIREKSKKKWL